MGTVYEVRPIVLDEPFSKVMVTFFKAPTPANPTMTIGDVTATKGGPAVELKAKPSFKVSIKAIDLPPAPNRTT